MTIYTIGYEGRTVESFIAGLKAERITHLIDVREMPLSRKRGFSKTALAQVLEGAGIRYSHVKALGCPKPIRDRFRHDHDWARYTRDFMRYLQAQAEVIAALRVAVRGERSCLMCFEADFDRCHRTFVARAITAPARRSVVHLTADDTVIEDSSAVA